MCTMREFENKVLRKIYGPRSDEVLTLGEVFEIYIKNSQFLPHWEHGFIHYKQSVDAVCKNDVCLLFTAGTIIVLCTFTD